MWVWTVNDSLLKVVDWQLFDVGGDFKTSRIDFYPFADWGGDTVHPVYFYGRDASLEDCYVGGIDAGTVYWIRLDPVYNSIATVYATEADAINGTNPVVMTLLAQPQGFCYMCDAGEQSNKIWTGKIVEVGTGKQYPQSRDGINQALADNACDLLLLIYPGTYDSYPLSPDNDKPLIYDPTPQHYRIFRGMGTQPGAVVLDGSICLHSSLIAFYGTETTYIFENVRPGSNVHIDDNFWPASGQLYIFNQIYWISSNNDYMPYNGYSWQISPTVVLSRAILGESPHNNKWLTAGGGGQFFDMTKSYMHRVYKSGNGDWVRADESPKYKECDTYIQGGYYGCGNGEFLVNRVWIEEKGPQMMIGNTIAPKIYPNLVSNSKNWVGASGATPPTGWTATGNGTYGISIPYLTVVKAGTSVTRQAINVESGNNYTFSITGYKSGTSLVGVIVSSDLLGAYPYGTITFDTSTETQTLTFTATSGVVYVTLFIIGTGTTTGYWANAKMIKE